MLHRLINGQFFHYLALALVVGLGISGAPAMACAICITAPEKTLVDRILESETVLFAREDPSRPFSFAPVAVLKGSVDDVSLPFLVDSTVRRRLNATPEAAVLVVRTVRSPVRPLVRADPEPTWLQLAYADGEFRAIIDQILALEDSWMADRTGQARFDFFEALHDHADPAIRELAVSELARAPYRFIRGMTLRLTPAEIATVLRDPAMLTWAPTYKLLLGRSADPAVHQMVRDRVRTPASHAAPSDLAAWATALVEIDGAPGVDLLAQRYIKVPTRTAGELQEVLSALGVHAQDGDPSLQPVLVTAFHEFARAHPELAPVVAYHLLSLKDWSQVDYFECLLDSERAWSAADRMMLQVYVGMARDEMPLWSMVEVPNEQCLREERRDT